MDPSSSSFDRAGTFIKANAWWMAALVFFAHIHGHQWSDMHTEAVQQSKRAEQCADSGTFNAFADECTKAIIAANRWTFFAAAWNVVTLCWLDTVFSSALTTLSLSTVVFLAASRFIPGVTIVTTRLLAMCGLIDRSTAAQPNVVLDMNGLINSLRGQKDPNYLK